jgi:DNA-binding NarL/FixJ family response regulator
MEWLMPEGSAQKLTEILLVSKYALFRESLGRLLSREPDFKVAAECASMAHGLEVLKRQPVDVVLLEFDSGQEEAADFILAARGQGFKSRLLLLAEELNEGSEADLIRAGVSGVFHKRDSAASLRHAIRDVAAGKLWFTQEQLQRALTQDTLSPFSHLNLTPREKRVLSLVSDGLKDREIGAQLGLSEGSAKAILQQLFSKFGVRSRSRLVRIALQQP